MIPKSVMSFDELNLLITKPRSMPYEKFFGEMGIPKESKAMRKKMADDFEELFIEILAEEFYSGKDGKHLEEQYISDKVSAEYIDIANKYGIKPDKNKAKEFADGFARVTVKHNSEPYYISQDRAILNAENVANMLGNQGDYDSAINNRKTKKRWYAIIDDVTRETHIEADGQTVDIDKPFHVGGSLLLYPTDTSLGADIEEVANCRCWITYK